MLLFGQLPQVLLPQVLLPQAQVRPMLLLLAQVLPPRQLLLLVPQVCQCNYLKHLRMPALEQCLLLPL